MLVKIDENLPTSLVGLLAGRGHDAHHVEDEGLRAWMDPIVAAAAKPESRILLTLDVEFADIRKHPPGSHPGIVLFRSSISGAPAINHLVLELLAAVPDGDSAGLVTTVEQGKIRVRRP